MPSKTTKKGYVEKSITIPPGMTRALKPILRRHGLTFSAFAREALTALMVAYNKIDKEAENEGNNSIHNGDGSDLQNNG